MDRSGKAERGHVTFLGAQCPENPEVLEEYTLEQVLEPGIFISRITLYEVQYPVPTAYCQYRAGALEIPGNGWPT